MDQLLTYASNPIVVALALVAVAIVFPRLAPSVVPLLDRVLKKAPTPTPDTKPEKPETDPTPLLNLLRKIIEEKAEGKPDAWAKYLANEINYQGYQPPPQATNKPTTGPTS